MLIHTSRTLTFAAVAVVSLACYAHASDVLVIKRPNPINEFEASAEKARIDSHPLKPLKVQVHEIITYTVHHIADEIKKPDSKFNRHPYIRAMCSMQFLKQIKFQEFRPIIRCRYEGYSPDLIISEGFRFLRNILDTDAELTKEDLLRTAVTASVLLAPEIFEENFKYKHQSPIHELSLEARNDIAKDGVYRLHIGGQFACQHYNLMVLTGADAIFSRIGFIYALSQGTLMQAVTALPESAHGNLYADALSLIIHDLAHNNEIVMGKFGDLGETSESILARRLQLKEIHVKMAGFLYSILSESGIFNNDDMRKAILAAFNLLHEYLLLDTYSYELLNIKSALKAGDKLRSHFDWFVTRLKCTIKARLSHPYEARYHEADKLFGVPEADIKAQQEAEQEKKDLAQKEAVGTLDYQFNRDHATSIIAAYPEATDEIFPEGVNGFYFSRKAADWNLKLIDWFDAKVKASNVFTEYSHRLLDE